MTTHEDIELLSAYLDGAVSPAEGAALERRLEQEPQLREALDELRATVSMLRELPALTPPRSFTINPAAQRPRIGAALVGWMRLGSALAAVLLALSVTFEFAGSRSSETAAPMAGFALATSEPESIGGAPEADTYMAPEKTAPPLLAAVPTEEPVSAMEAPERAILPQATTDEAPPSAPEPRGDGSAPTDDGGTYQPLDTQQNAHEDTARDMIEDPKNSSPNTQELPSAPAEPTGTAPQPALAPFRLVQFSLGTLALLLGLGSVWLARQRPR